MKRATIQTALVWTALAVLCIAGSVYEYPQVVDSVRCFRRTFVPWNANVTILVPERVVARDPEAGAILRFILEHRYQDPNLPELRRLVADHPRNEFFLARLIEGFSKSEHPDRNEVLAIADQLLAVDPDNAHFHYLRAWVLLESPQARERIDEILGEFEQADRLSEFSTPYETYRDRVAQLAREASLPSDRRPWLYPWPYRHLGRRLVRMGEWRTMDRESFRQLMTSATRMADRVIADARSLESLRTGAELMEEVEKAKLQKQDLTEAEAWQARQRLGQAIAIDGLKHREHLATPLRVPLPAITAWLALAAGIVLLVSAALRPNKAWPAMQLKPELGPHKIPGVLSLIGLVLVWAFYGWRYAGFGVLMLLMLSWYMIWFPWITNPGLLVQIHAIDAVRPKRTPWRSRTAHALFWLNGTLLLLMSNSAFFVSGRLTERPQHIALFVVWSAFCLLAWRLMPRPRGGDSWPRQNPALAALLFWAAALIGFDVFGAQQAYESQLWANPLSVHGSIPAAARETYEHYIRDGSPLEEGASTASKYVQSLTPEEMEALFTEYRAEGKELTLEQFQGRLERSVRKLYTLPRYIGYLTPADMESFLAQRQAQGEALSDEQLRTILWRCARDVRPVLQAAIDSRTDSAAPANATRQTETTP